MTADLPLLFLDIDGVMLKRRQPGLLDAFEQHRHEGCFVWSDRRVPILE